MKYLFLVVTLSLGLAQETIPAPAPVPVLTSEQKDAKITTQADYIKWLESLIALKDAKIEALMKYFDTEIKLINQQNAKPTPK